MCLFVCVSVYVFVEFFCVVVFMCMCVCMCDFGVVAFLTMFVKSLFIYKLFHKVVYLFFVHVSHFVCFVYLRGPLSIHLQSHPSTTPQSIHHFIHLFIHEFIYLFTQKFITFFSHLLFIHSLVKV